MRKIALITLGATLALGLTGFSPQGSVAEPDPLALLAQAQGNQIAGAKIQNLFKQLLAKDFTPGREVLVDLVEVPPNTTLDRHWHPGEEFHYYLEGEPQILIKGKPTIQAKVGSVVHIPFKAEHTLATKDKGAKLLVFRVHTAGEPLRYLPSDR